MKGANNTADHPPQYCPPTIPCQITRLGQIKNTCDRPQGTYEPIVCPGGSFCPPGGKQQIICPSGHYCPIGSTEPTPCARVAICPAQSQRQIDISGLVAMLIIDLMIVLYFVWSYLHSRRSQSPRQSKADWPLPNLDVKRRSLWTSSPLKRLSRRASRDSFVELQDVVRTDEEGFVVDSSDSEFREFIEPLTACVHGNNATLSLDFQGIGYKLKGQEKAIITDITGTLKSGSLWGVMGASGSGKCTSISCHSSDDANTHSDLGQRATREVETYFWYHPRQWY